MANPDHVALARQGSAAINKYVGENPGVHLDLSDADLSGQNLSECDLGHANLAGANLAGADLRNARLGGADLQGAVLSHADARGTTFHRANLGGADLRGIKFDPIGIGRQLICLSPNSFNGARWDREYLEEILAALNLNRDWEIRYEIVPRSGRRRDGQGNSPRPSPAAE